MMRDILKNDEYFKAFISEIQGMIDLSVRSLKENKIPIERVPWIRLAIFNNYLSKCIAQYSMGCSFLIIKKSYIDALNAMEKGGWIPLTTKVSLNPEKYLDQYMVEPYSKMLRMLALGYLLKIEEKDFQVLVDIIDQDNICDNLYEFIIKARFSKREQNKKEEYVQGKSIILESYQKLRKSIDQKETSEAIKLIREYLTNYFYHKHSGFYNSHKSRANIYYGYWSFETAAIVAILGLDDSVFRGCKYYPSDLVDFYIGKN